MKTYQQFTLEAYDRSTGRPHRGTDYKGRDYGGGPDDKPTVKIPLSGVMQGGWSKKEKKKKDVNEAGDWWHPDPEQDKKLPGKGPQMRAREDRGQSTSAQTKPDYSNRLKPGETYMQFAKRKAMGEDFELDEGMTLKDYKKKRSALKQKEKRAADKIAPNRRKDIHTDRLSPERAARHRANVDPDFEGNDERNYPGGKLRPNKVRKAKAIGELG